AASTPRHRHLAVLSDQASPVSTPYCSSAASTWAHRRLLLEARCAARRVCVASTSSNTSPTWFSARFVSLLRPLSGELTKTRRKWSTDLEPSPAFVHASPGLF